MKLYCLNLIPRGREKRLDKTAPGWKWVYLESCLADWARTNSKFKALTERLEIDKYTNQQILQEIWVIDINIKQRIEPKQVDALMVDDREQNIDDNDRTIDAIHYTLSHTIWLCPITLWLCPITFWLCPITFWLCPIRFDYVPYDLTFSIYLIFFKTS